ncbi:MAG: M28 family peptidase, partial [Solirubrobacterales bacterium]
MRMLRTIVGHICVASVVLFVGEGLIRADIVQEAVDKVSVGQYRVYQIDIQDMGLGLYGGPEYDQGYRNRDGWAYGTAKYKTTWNQGGTPGNLETRLYLADQLEAMGLKVTVDGTYRNVVAELRGTERPQDIYIVSAHYDTTTYAGERPGGDDNASGTAGVVEAARVLSQYNSAATLRFIAFNAEEDWMLGSQEYVDDVVEAGKENVVGVLNLDMILRPGWDSDPDAAVDLDIETGTSQTCVDWAYVFIDAIAAYVPTLKVDAAAPDWEYWDSGDQGPFIEAGHPALMIAENTAIEIWSYGCNGYYHKSGDASDAGANDPCSASGVTYDYDFAADVVRAAVATLAQEAGITAKSGPNFVEVQAFDTEGAQDVEFFTMEGNRYLAIANGRGDQTYDANAVVYAWDGNDFVPMQSIPSQGAADCEFFTMDDDRYLAIANMRDDATFAVESKLYRWDGTSFTPFQSIETEGAADCEFFTIGDGSYLAIANSRTDATTATNSVVYRWDGSAFGLFQLLPTRGARDCEF